jgi:FLYWCH zinc finger domain
VILVNDPRIISEFENYLKLSGLKKPSPGDPPPPSRLAPPSYRTKPRKKLDMRLIDEAQSMDYTYNHRGSIIFQNNVFQKGHGSAKQNTYTWRCQRSNGPTKCPVLLKTRGKSLVSIHGEHTHSVATKEAGVKAKVFKDI